MSVAGESQSIQVAQSTERAACLSESDLGYRGWRVVLAASLGVMGGFGSLFVYTFAVFMKPLSAEFGWSREQISSGFGVAAVTLGIVSPLLGRWLDRFGPRRVILPSVIVFSGAIASLALLQPQLSRFYLTCFVLGVVGNGAAHLAYSRSISTWFERRLGIALAFVMVGAGLGAMILPLVAQTIISRSGWRAAYASLGLLAFLLGFPLSWRYVRERLQIRRDSSAIGPVILGRSFDATGSYASLLVILAAALAAAAAILSLLPRYGVDEVQPQTQPA